MDELAEPAEICSTPMKILPRSNQISMLLLEVHTTSRQIFDLIDKVHFSYHKKIWTERSPFLHFANFPLFLLVSCGRCPKFVGKNEVLLDSYQQNWRYRIFCWASNFKFTKYKQTTKYCKANQWLNKSRTS